MTPAAISKIEKGERKLTVQMAKAICNEFRVNQEWLIHGAGEMFQEFPTTLLDQLSAEFDLDDMEKQLVKDFITLDKEQRQTITQFLQNAINQ
ncbi:helix-turn-helix domain-containing protein [Clostridium facile]|uniref:Helix-turn-helix transcriptional regulator n=1 Tax=Clostridium facile TaxID=2763035 RepID=A0ABR7IP64_9CLOT|nr:helix-turn-helix transcriptional regulator [Clostridium facile]